jgi:hypothetical protein
MKFEILETHDDILSAKGSRRIRLSKNLESKNKLIVKFTQFTTLYVLFFRADLSGNQLPPKGFSADFPHEFYDPVGLVIW